MVPDAAATGQSQLQRQDAQCFLVHNMCQSLFTVTVQTYIHIFTIIYIYIYLYIYIYIYISIKFVFNLVMIDAMARF